MLLDDIIQQWHAFKTGTVAVLLLEPERAQANNT